VAGGKSKPFSTILRLPEGRSPQVIRGKTGWRCFSEEKVGEGKENTEFHERGNLRCLIFIAESEIA